ncbi:MAG TPA: hypothetical protein VJ276_15020, partial [Thermoanaerobaculia bacterium]|nr:hypothetical protein [Thermoanaerobaculia bacterium]
EKLGTTFEFLFKNTLRSFFRRFKRYGYAIVTFGTPLNIDEMVKADPGLLAPTFEERKPHLQLLADRVMSEISKAVPVTPVTLVARVFAAHEGPIPDEVIVAEIERHREQWSDRPWLLREKTGAEIWSLAKKLLTLRHLVEQTPDGWRWTPAERLLRDYYANSLLTFEEVKERGWPERKSGAQASRLPAATRLVSPGETPGS